MITYDFYTGTYLGSSITAEEWPTFVARAQDQLNKYRRIYTVVAPDKNAEAMAVCAMADTLNFFVKAQSGTGAIASASIGSVSVNYGNATSSIDLSPKAQEKEMYRCACTYLEIYRGVG